MTVRQLSSELTWEELIGWSAYFSIKNDEYENEKDNRATKRVLGG